LIIQKKYQSKAMMADEKGLPVFFYFSTKSPFVEVATNPLLDHLELPTAEMDSAEHGTFRIPDDVKLSDSDLEHIHSYRFVRIDAVYLIFPCYKNSAGKFASDDIYCGEVVKLVSYIFVFVLTDMSL